MHFVFIVQHAENNYKAKYLNRKELMRVVQVNIRIFQQLSLMLKAVCSKSLITNRTLILHEKKFIRLNRINFFVLFEKIFIVRLKFDT